ncbi:formimidoylglutamase [Aliidiomarina soli]|uniref:Arginase n=1 Tax=Aliidiomarina soli TaxID=1928574 RepID=A0A432WF47_9GAMM|nr:formimidoylglutamase [Aliidiomarina soli]RUO32381.1 arginase [Aliidiomarina soli]
MAEYLRRTNPQPFVKTREQETKIGQAIACLREGDDFGDLLTSHLADGCKVALLGVPESIGPRANCGRGGSEGGWQAFLTSFLNLQATPAMPVHELLLLGHVDCDDLMAEAADLDAADAQDLNRLRELCAQVDQRVLQVLRPLFDAGYEVILIGGGHNNAYPLLTALYESQKQRCGSVNLDPHADFRPREGRHSGNGFSYAYMEGALSNYHVVSLHEGKNSATSLKQMADAGFSYHSIHRLYDMQFVDALEEVSALAKSWDQPTGIEVDVDAIMQAPASALNYTGVSMAQGYRFVSRLASLPQVHYVHLAEAAPARHPAGQEAGLMASGQLLTELTLAYLFGREQRGL